MALVNKNQVDQNQNGKVVLIEEILSDGSSVFEIRIYSDQSFDEFSYSTIDCINKEAAENLFIFLGNQSDYIFND